MGEDNKQQQKDFLYHVPGTVLQLKVLYGHVVQKILLIKYSKITAGEGM